MVHINGADTAFVIFSTALVMLMTPGLALFYGGMVRSKNVLSTTMHSYAALVIISLQWVFFGYSFAFGPSMLGGFIGNFKYLFLHGVGVAPNPIYSGSISQILFMLFQMMFAIITAAVVSGSFAERMRFGAFILFILLWSTFVYDPIAHWVWSGTGSNAGFIKHMGTFDFAGGFVVEINSGVSGLITALVLGKRKKANIGPHHIPMTLLGAGLLWFGWFGFNAGSALSANGVALNAFLTTNTAGAAGALSWMICEWIINKKPTILGVASGGIAGLVAITGGAGYVSVMPSVLIGLIAGAACFFAIVFVKAKFGYDDALDAFGCHGVGGMLGVIATAIFATKAVNSGGVNGLIHGNPHLLLTHLIAMIACVAYAAAATFIILKIVGLITPLRVDEESEVSGLDISIHGENAYGDFNNYNY